MLFQALLLPTGKLKWMIPDFLKNSDDKPKARRMSCVQMLK
jgi:hypothetical protein